MDIGSFKKECQAFIFNWPRVTQNARFLQIQFSDLGIETWVINSDDAERGNGLPNWVHIGDSGYMVQQYAKAVECFNKTYFVEMFADIYDVEAELIIQRAGYVFSKYKCGVYAPNVEFMNWKFDRKTIPELEEHLYEVKNAESLLSFIHKDVVRDIRLDPGRYKYGWGIDFLVCVLAFQQQKKVIRDYITTIRHPKSKGYDSGKARAEFEQFMSEQDPVVESLMRKWLEEANSLRIA
ncbi:MAG TPA: hypothetical protein PJ991_05585 [Kiritimatiellia bacterium]|nr:hypothetical protein [Kiritimatiellia bacterium]